MSGGDVVVDDHLLLRILLGDEPPELRPRGGRIATTGLWYHRLCRALAGSRVTGALSRLLGGQQALGERAVRSVITLPDEIDLMSLRALAWPMAQLVDDGARLNLLSLEALAAAIDLDAVLCLSTVDENPPLMGAAGVVGVPTRLIRSP
ncbi:hypothetical protein BH23ACT2_BH23ACT2_14900 [soil metagenome]